MAIRSAAARLHLLTARQIHAAAAGDLGDGGGLLLRVGPTSASGVLRYTAPSGKRREMGLGIAERGTVARAGQSLTTARDQARKARESLRQGVGPIDEREGGREAAQAQEAAKKAAASIDRWTMAGCARDYHERVIERTGASDRRSLGLRRTPADPWSIS
jgi:Arm DNA-binding domain